MQTLPQLGGRRLSRRDPGMVLVIILAMIVLVTIAIMAFFTHATANQQVETSRSNRTEADLLAQSAGDYVTGLLMSEITSSANSTNNTQSGVVFYRPLSSTNAVPRRALSSGISSTDTNFFNLIRQSTPNNSADTNASSHGTAVSSRNGRLVGASRWNFPMLLGPSGFATNQLPNWIYITRDGGVTATPGTNVIGRFAYNVYDIGGLLNANVAGFPSSIATTNISRLKSSIAGADLTLLPGLSSGSSAINDLVRFRNNGSLALDDVYVQTVNAFLEEGYTNGITTNLSPAYTNNFFTSRQDLIRYVRTQNKLLTNALPYLTHFSRSLTTPAWYPVNPSGLSGYDYAGNKNMANSANRDLLGVRFAAAAKVMYYADNGTIYKEDGVNDGHDASAGSALVERKFSLAKLAWLGPAGPNESAFASSVGESARVAAIQAVFGLVWNENQNRWDYAAAATSPSPHIRTLAEVADLNRPPNFFELLKAGILAGSIGVVGSQKTLFKDGPTSQYVGDYEDERTFSDNGDLQILRIGANIIDCADADNYPTIIALDTSVSSTALPVEVAGVEDLPYLSYLDMWSFRQAADDASNPPWLRKMTACDIIWTPEFFNPHVASVSSDSPAQIKMDVLSGVITRVGSNVGQNYNNHKPAALTIKSTGTSSGYPDTGTINKSLLGMPSITIPAASFENFRNGPQPASVGELDPASLGVLVPYSTANRDLGVIRMYSYQNDYTFTGYALSDGWGSNTPWTWWYYYNNSSGSSSHFMAVDNLVIALSYRTASGAWKVYSTFGGYITDDNAAITYTGMNGVWNWNGNWTIGKYLFSFFPMVQNGGTNITAFNSQMMFAAKWDPRTSRLGAAFGQQGNKRALGALPTTSGNTGQISFAMPFSSPAAPLYPGLRPQAGKTSADAWPDSDGVYRPCDASAGSSANLFVNISDPARRPVILQRPYRSVGELGYVFRDTPWKSLSFFDETSADSALLDLFSVSDEPPVTAAMVNANTRQTPVQSTLLANSMQANGSTDPLASASVSSIARVLTTNYIYNAGLPTTNMSDNVAFLPAFMSSSGLASAISLDPIKNRREAIVRSLAPSFQARTWNVLLDVIAQTGRFPSSSTGAGDFVVEGEQRVWFSKAIDRPMAKIIDQQTEVINE